jgi:hypothetical protein
VYSPVPFSLDKAHFSVGEHLEYNIDIFHNMTQSTPISLFAINSIYKIFSIPFQMHMSGPHVPA